MANNSAAYLSELHTLLNRYFSLEEIRTLCFNMGVDYESVPGAEKPSMIRNLLLVLGRKGRLQELVTLAARERRNVSWPPVPADFELPAESAAAAQAAPVTNYNHYGDVVHGDKIGRDKTTVGDISNSTGIAIGTGASAEVNINQGMSGAELNQLFAPLLATVQQENPAAAAKVEELKDEVAQGEEADDEKMAGLVEDIADAAPGVVEGLVGLFTNAPLAKIAGGATKYVLKRIRK